MGNASSDELRVAREAIIAAQHKNRPRGMPRTEGLLYQPVPFAGFEDLGCERNGSEHRLQMLLQWLQPSHKLRVLDFGCANAFFLFRLAQLGLVEQATGVDYFEGNVETGKILAALHGLDRVLSFREGNVTPELVDEMTSAGADLAIWLSVHHHIVRTSGIAAARDVFSLLYRRCDVVVVEQGSLTQEEYEAWTGRTEAFSTRAFTRLQSMAETCGIPSQNCFCIGMGRYLSGERDDMRGAGRVIMGFSRLKALPGGIESDLRKMHKNGIVMELLRLSSGVLVKNVVNGDKHFSVVEARALDALAGEPGFVRRLESPDLEGDWEVETGFLRLGAQELHEATAVDRERLRPQMREMLVQRLLSMARAGIVHGELHGEHLMLNQHDELICLDFETARFVAENDPDAWRREMEGNPALGLGCYPREALMSDIDALDLIAADHILGEWGCAPLTDDERSQYRSALACHA